MNGLIKELRNKNLFEATKTKSKNIIKAQSMGITQGKISLHSLLGFKLSNF